VANSTVFGAIAGDSMAAWVARRGEFRTPDDLAIDRAIARAERPFRDAGESDLEAIRDRLHTMMWDDAGIVRSAAGLARAAAALDTLAAKLDAYALPRAGRDRAFNLTWHDWLNLGSLIATSRAIVRAAMAREDSRGAHYRDDFPDPGELAASTYTRVRMRDGAVSCDAVPVRFQRVRPGESLLKR
jgi:fumarate reductase flavoprotein subunit